MEIKQTNTEKRRLIQPNVITARRLVGVHQLVARFPHDSNSPPFVAIRYAELKTINIMNITTDQAAPNPYSPSRNATSYTKVTKISVTPGSP